ncbi:MAG: PEP-CTERM sorting domain-containing protein [Hyphomicrobiales bacterium]|nr:PEP-CTERM sorting domain-containing protein [Hyphomicrobiales bacterium]
MTIKLASGIAPLGKTKLPIIAALAGVLGLPAVASAEIVTVTYTGSVILAPGGAGIPPASEGDTLVASYVFNLPNATNSVIDPTDGGFSAGPYGSFATASLTVNGVAAVLPTFATGQISGEVNVFDTGSVLDAEVTGADPATQLITLVDGPDFSWNLASPTNTSFSPSPDDEAITQLKTAAGGFLEGDVTSVTVTVSSSSPVPEPSTWAMILIGFAGVGLVSYRSRRRATVLAA